MAAWCRGRRPQQEGRGHRPSPRIRGRGKCRVEGRAGLGPGAPTAGALAPRRGPAARGPWERRRGGTRDGGGNASTVVFLPGAVCAAVMATAGPRVWPHSGSDQEVSRRKEPEPPAPAAGTHLPGRGVSWAPTWPTASCPLTCASDPRVGFWAPPNSGPRAPPFCFSLPTLTFQQGLQDGHVHVLLAVLAFPEDGQQLPPPYNVLDLQQTQPRRGLGGQRAPGSSGAPAASRPRMHSQGPGVRPPPCLHTPQAVRMKMRKDQIRHVREWSAGWRHNLRVRNFTPHHDSVC